MSLTKLTTNVLEMKLNTNGIVKFTSIIDVTIHEDSIIVCEDHQDSICYAWTDQHQAMQIEANL